MDQVVAVDVVRQGGILDTFWRVEPAHLLTDLMRGLLTEKVSTVGRIRLGKKDRVQFWP